MLKGSGGSVAGFLQFDLVPGLFQPGSDLVPALLRKKGSGGSVAGILQFQPGSGPGSARFRPGSIAPSSTFTMVPAWFHLVPTWFHRSKHFVLQRFLLGSAWLHLGSKPSDSFELAFFCGGAEEETLDEDC